MSLPLELGSFHRDQNRGSLERQLTCPICLEVFTKPVVILPCQHNLCRKCANELFQARGTMVGAGGRFRCPSCRHEVLLDRHGVYGLQRNLLVENIIDIYKQESGSSRLLLKTPGHPTCEEHDEEKLNIYCLTCQVPTCSLCKVFGAHKTCQVAPIPEVYEQQKAELSDGIGSLVAANDQLQGFIHELEDTCGKVEENCKTQKQTLCEKFDRMYSILEERRKIMLQRISYEQEEKSGHAHSLVQAYGEHVEANSKLVETALHTMEEPDMAAFLQSARSMIKKVTEATKSSTVEALEPGFENMDHYMVDFNAEERALYTLDFVKIEYEVEEVPEKPVFEPQPELQAGSQSEPEFDRYAVQEPIEEPLLERIQEPVQELLLEPDHEPIHEPIQEPILECIQEPLLEPDQEPIQEPILECIQEPVQKPVQENLLEPVHEPIQEPILECVQESVQEPLLEPVHEPIQEPILECVQEPVREPLLEPVQEPLLEPVQEPLLEPVQENLLEPVHEPIQEPILEPVLEAILEPDQQLEPKEDSCGAKAGETEDIKGQLDRCSDLKKEFPNDQKGLNTQQDEPELCPEEHDAGDLKSQCLLAEASEEAKLYPSWYKSNSWQARAPLPVPGEPQRGSDSFCPAAMETESPHSSMGTGQPVSCLETSNLIQGCHDGVRGPIGEGRGLGEGFTGQDDVTTPPLQVVTLLFYIMALAIIFLRVWGYIRCITCP